MNVFIVVNLSFLVLFLIMLALLSSYYRGQRIRLVSMIGEDVVLSVKNIRTYGREENGWKNNFPSVFGWYRVTLSVTRNFILVTGKMNFPFIFKTELQPFVVAVEAESTRGKLCFDRVYAPANIRVTDYGRDLELTIKPKGVLGLLKIHLTFENIGKSSIDKIFDILETHEELTNE